MHEAKIHRPSLDRDLGNGPSEIKPSKLGGSPVKETGSNKYTYLCTYKFELHNYRNVAKPVVPRDKPTEPRYLKSTTLPIHLYVYKCIHRCIFNLSRIRFCVECNDLWANLKRDSPQECLQWVCLSKSKYVAAY